MGFLKSVVRVKGRPLSVTIVALVGLLAFVITTWKLFMPWVINTILRQGGPFFLYGLMVFNLVSFCGLMGYLMMRKWGVYCYVFTALGSFGFSVYYVFPQSIAGLVLPVVTILVGLVHLRKMS